MRIWIIFLAVLACFSAVAATASFNEGDMLWGWICTICVVINLANMSFWVATMPSDK